MPTTRKGPSLYRGEYNTRVPEDDYRFPKRNRVRRLCSAVKWRLQVANLGLVSANGWHLLTLCAGLPRAANSKAVASALNTTVATLSTFVVELESRLGYAADYWLPEDVYTACDAIRRDGDVTRE